MNGERVVIVGGGLAGLAAAVELVDRALDVTLIESAERCGGKLAAWRDQDGDLVEHGIHGWWPNYVNFLKLMERVGIPAETLKVAPSTLAVRTDGSTLDLKPLPVRLPSPLFLVAYFLRQPVRGVVDLLSVVRAGLHILAFDAKRDFDELDRYTFRSWLWRLGVSQRMYEFFFEPYVRGFAFDSSTRISAAAVLSSYHLYLVRHQDDIRARWLTGDPDTTVIEPIVKYIRDRGGRVINGVRVERLVDDPRGQVVALETSKAVDAQAPHEPPGIDAVTRVSEESIPEIGFVSVSVEYGQRVIVGREHGEVVAYAGESEEDSRVEMHQPLLRPAVGTREVPSEPPVGVMNLPSAGMPLRADLTAGGVVVRSQPAEGTGTELARVALASVPQEGFVLIPAHRPIMVGRVGGRADVMALSASCTHMGCTVAWRSETGAFTCPCHGAIFGPDGHVLGGPTETPLRRYAVRIEDGQVVVLSETAAPPRLEGDHFILAVDVESCKALMSDRLRNLETFRRIDSLGTTPVIVVRIWFPGEKLLGDLNSGAFMGYPFLDNFFVVSNMQEPLRDKGETVVEVQAYTVDDEIEFSEERIRELALADLRRAFPALSLEPRKCIVLKHPTVFTHHAAGSDAYRPGTRTPLPNLYLAGDWVNRRSETWNMERAVASGKLAAAAVVEDVGGIGPTVELVPTGGTMFKLFGAAVRRLGSVGTRMASLVRGDPKRHHREPAMAAPRWISTVGFVATKFKGMPNEQLVTGKLWQVDGKVRLARRGPALVATGDFTINLETVDSGLALRDYNLRTVVLQTPVTPTADFQLTEARPIDGPVRSVIFDREFTVDCLGELTVATVKRPLRFRAKVKLLREGLLSARAEEPIIVRAEDLGFDLEALRDRCGVVVAPEIQLGFRVAVPFRVRNRT